MIISRQMLNEIEQISRKPFPKEFKRYVLVKYSEDPFPYEYSEQV